MRLRRGCQDYQIESIMTWEDASRTTSSSEEGTTPSERERVDMGSAVTGTLCVRHVALLPSTPIVIN
jgi:hypothetical protein